MSKRFLRFVDQWLEDNLDRVSATVAGAGAAARRIAEQCAAEAAAAGYTRQEIDEEAAALEARVAKALVAAAAEEGERYEGGDD